MALVCKCGDRECVGCGGCNSEKTCICEVCGAKIEEDDGYYDFFHRLLCLDCLKAIHKL